MGKKTTVMILLLVFVTGVYFLTLMYEKQQTPVLTGKLSCSEGELQVTVRKHELELHAADGKLIQKYESDREDAEVVDCCIGDIDGDSEEELFVIEGSGMDFYGNRLLIFSYDNGLKRLYDREFKELNPWKIELCDTDGDGRQEIALGVYKKAAFHPVMARRPFLYHWNGEDIVPMWRGSRLSRPFDDYVYHDMDADGSDELIAVELLSDGKKVINVYCWKGFGFESVAESSPYFDISALSEWNDGQEGLFIRTKKSGAGEWLRLEMSGDRLTEKAETDKIAGKIK